jgi:hypothetical protein
VPQRVVIVLKWLTEVKHLAWRLDYER